VNEISLCPCCKIPGTYDGLNTYNKPVYRCESTDCAGITWTAEQGDIHLSPDSFPLLVKLDVPVE
jgi:hypothetical protein